MIINALILCLGLILDAIFSVLLPVDFSVQLFVIIPLFTLNFYWILSYQMSTKDKWLWAMVIATIVEMNRFDSYLITYLVMAAMVVLFEIFSRVIGQTRVSQFVASIVYTFMYLLFNHASYLFVSDITMSFSYFFKTTLLPTIVFNVLAIIIGIRIDLFKEAYLDKRDVSKRKKEKITYYDQEFY